jgi:ribonuclease HI
MILEMDVLRSDSLMFSEYIIYNSFMILKVFTDGGSKGNPGPAAIGIVAYADTAEFFRYREDIGIGTNNVAEYSAVIKALEIVKEKVTRDSLLVTRLEFFADSELVVKQLNGLYKIKNDAIREFIFKIRSLEGDLKIPVSYTHIPREKNKVADGLVNNVNL